MSALDRDKARNWCAQQGIGGSDAQLDALEACVTPVPEHTIDRDALHRVLHEILVETADLGLVMSTTEQQYNDRVLALVRPVEGVVLSREEVRLALVWWGGFVISGIEPIEPHAVQLKALARRLEASL